MNPAIKDPNTKYIIFTHGNCPDGAAAAAVIDGFLRETYGASDIDIHYCSFGDGTENRVDVSGAYVFITDYSFPAAVLYEMAKFAVEVVLLDHHESARDAIFRDLPSAWMPANLHVIFDMDRSGTGLAWDYCNGVRVSLDRPQIEPMPKLYAYVQDRDLWRFDLPDSREVNAYICNAPFDLQSYRLLNAELASDFGRVLMLGKSLYAYQLLVAKAAADTAVEVSEGEYRYGLACASNMVSETGDFILERFPGADFSLTYYDSYKRGCRVVSMRSRKGGPINVGTIAKRMGGGGHPSSAGFQLPLNAPIVLNPPKQL